jgi:hypothetical protein
MLPSFFGKNLKKMKKTGFLSKIWYFDCRYPRKRGEKRTSQDESRVFPGGDGSGAMTFVSNSRPDFFTFIRFENYPL